MEPWKVTEPTAQQAWERTLSDLIEDKSRVEAVRSGVELLGYTVAVADVRARTGGHPLRSLGTVAAVARWVWMMAASDRVADIAFYEPKVSGYTDDSVIVPGSNYGARLRAAAPGLDQVAAAIARLKGDDGRPDNHLRRAANVIWRPEDAQRDSQDIPCAFGVGYFPRHGRLHTELVMRSNNAMLLLPFNLFEFSLLSETVAVAAGLEPGPMTIHAMSMHLYDGVQEREVAEALRLQPGAGLPAAMPPLPADDPLGQINGLVRAEADLRHAQAAVASHPLERLRERAGALDPYWQSFFDVLLVHHLLVANRVEPAHKLARTLPDWARTGAQRHVERWTRDHPPAGGAREASTLFDANADARAPAATQDKLRAALGDAEDDPARAHIYALLDELESEFRVSHADGQRVANSLLARELEVAARSRPDGASGDYLQLSAEDVRAAVRQLRLGS